MAFLRDILQKSWPTWEAICVWIDYFCPRDNERQQGSLWRNSCFPEINILFGSLSPSSKILIRATVSLPRDVCVYLCTYVHAGGQHSRTKRLLFCLFLSTLLTWPCERIWQYSNCMIVGSSGSSAARRAAVVIWLIALQQDESTRRNNDLNCQFIHTVTVLVRMLHCDLTGYKQILNALQLGLQTQVGWKRGHFVNGLCARTAILMRLKCLYYVTVN